MKLGAQLFTVRDHAKDQPSLERTLEKISDIGYTTVQLSGICPYDPAWMRDTLKRLGLSAPITHFDFKRITEVPEETSAFHKTFGADYIGIGCSPFSFDEEGLEKLTKSLARVADYYHSQGQKLMYHNHNMEFARLGDALFLERLTSLLDADRLGITLDTYWAQAGGADPAQWLTRLAGRVDCIHLKDMAVTLPDRGQKMMAVGRGNMNFEAILSCAERAGTRYAFVEQDDCNGEDPFDCLKQSYDYLKALGLS